jgi:hypothetical protein
MSLSGTIIQTLAIIFGVVWIWINVYQFYPILVDLTGKTVRKGTATVRQSGREPASARTDGGTPAPEEMDQSDREEIAQTDGGESGR